MHANFANICRYIVHKKCRVSSQETSDGEDGRTRRRTPDILLRIQEREQRRAAKKEEIRKVFIIKDLEN